MRYLSIQFECPKFFPHVSALHVAVKERTHWISTTEVPHETLALPELSRDDVGMACTPFDDFSLHHCLHVHTPPVARRSLRKLPKLRKPLLRRRVRKLRSTNRGAPWHVWVS